ncbi:MAG: glycosyltransferase family 4 protein [Burkholderiales bacterium]|nr:glycosyltransferase family 4 protein [Burkholderiales bacterium]
MKIGYLVPEFPGQTHNFFWRELAALKRLGVTCDLLSTRPPHRGLRSTAWEAEAVGRTSYLFPLRGADIPAIAGALLVAGPRSWLAVIRAVSAADMADWKERARFAATTLLGAKLVALSRRHGWQHVHVHSCANSANIAVLAHLIGGITYSLTLHNPLWVYGSNQKMKWRNAAFCIVITEAVRQDVLTSLSGNLPPHIAVAPMGVEVDVFRRSQPYAGHDGRSPFKVFCCARLARSKGHEGLVRAVAQLRQEGMDIELAIAGEDDSGGSGYRLALQATLAELGFDPRDVLLGPLPEDAVRERIEQAHLFVLNSDEEPLGVALMEAMSMEVPVVATRAGGVPELVQDGVSGVLVPPGDQAALAATIRALAADPERCLALGRAGRERVIEGFSSERSARTIAALVPHTGEASH